MNLSTLFRLEEDVHLDKNTLVNLRWIAIIGQLITINVVFFYLEFEFPIIISHVVIFFGLISNLFLQFKFKSVQVNEIRALTLLIYDLFQLTVLLYLTGGISNPFIILLIIPTVVSSTFLSKGTTIILGILTLCFLFLLNIFHYPLPGIHENSFTFPKFYLVGLFLAIMIGLIFLSYFGIRFAGEVKKRSSAFNKLQQVIAKEYELENLGGQAAAAAHSLGTPLSTIMVVAKELKNEIGETSKHAKDLDLLISQTRRCGEILKKISQKEIIEDKFMSAVKIEDLLSEILRSFIETSDKDIKLNSAKNKNQINITRSPEMIYGLRNFIGNAVKFSNKKVEVQISSDESKINIIIADDGPGFPEDIIDVLGQPYIKSKEFKSNSGLGVGTFLGKTLLERSGAKLTFSSSIKYGGAVVQISWSTSSLIVNS